MPNSSGVVLIHAANMRLFGVGDARSNVHCTRRILDARRGHSGGWRQPFRAIDPWPWLDRFLGSGSALAKYTRIYYIV